MISCKFQPKIPDYFFLFEFNWKKSVHFFFFTLQIIHYRHSVMVTAGLANLMDYFCDVTSQSSRLSLSLVLAEHPAIPGWENHRCTGTTPLFTWTCSVCFFVSSNWKRSTRETVSKAWRLSRALLQRNRVTSKKESFHLCIEVRQWIKGKIYRTRKGIVWRGKRRLLLGIEMNCLWHHYPYILDTPHI